MTVFGDQLKNRIEKDAKAVDTNRRLLGEVLSAGNHNAFAEGFSEWDDARQLEHIARYFKLPVPEFSRENRTLDDLIEELNRSTGISERKIRLTGDWRKNGDGVMLVRVKNEDSHVALFPDTFGGYYFIDNVTQNKRHVTKKEAGRFEEEARCFYKPLPVTELSRKEFLGFLIKQIRPADIFLYVGVTILISLLATVVPLTTNLAFAEIIPADKESSLILMYFFLLVLEVCNYLLLRSVNYSLIMRMQYRLDVVLENSVYSRVLNMPVSFFSGEAAGGLAERISALNTIPILLGDILCVFTSIVTAFISLVPVLGVVPKLTLAILIPLLLILVVLVISLLQERDLAMKRLVSEEKSGSVVFDLISGMQRLKLSGSEDRAYAKWLRQYSDKAGAAYAVRFPMCAKTQLVRTIHLTGLLGAFFLAYVGGVEVPALAAFSSAYEIVILNMTFIANRTVNLAKLRPILKMAEPILETEPEFGTDKTVVKSITGAIELKHVTFRYEDASPAVLDDLSLEINPGEYVAIVGGSGCGKTTLVKLLLGFASPQQGTIHYDNMNIESVDLRSLRRRIGTVLQDGKLFAGDIYSNITITDPSCTMEDAWEAAEMVGLAEDIRRMPMGMQTLISEGNGGVSGGQKQRLLIARAIVNKPRVVIMDEATSALDNLTQKRVTESMDSLNCTRIVIAHRLSTIRDCDRIIALKDGRIAESGSYDELMEKNGFFAELVRRQLIDPTETDGQIA